MTSRQRSQCSTCVHFRSPLDTGLLEPSCAAFPEVIPEPVLRNEVDHRQPIDGDHGIQWTSDGRAFPEYAMVVSDDLSAASRRMTMSDPVDITFIED